MWLRFTNYLLDSPLVLALCLAAAATALGLGTLWTLTFIIAHAWGMVHGH